MKKIHPLKEYQEHHPAWVEVNLSQFQTNLKKIKKMIGPHCLFMLPVKANAYGHGLVEMSRCAQDSKQVDYLGVSCLQEGIILRKSGITLPILVLGAFSMNQVEELVTYNLEITLSSHDKAQAVMQFCKSHQLNARVHLEVETGMQRTGMRPETLFKLFEKIENVEVVGVYSHLACADDENLESHTIKQINLFSEVARKVRAMNPKILLHLCNSAGLVNYPDHHYDMVRPGILSFGLFPKLLTPILSLKATISFFKVVAKGQGISYGHTYTTTEETRIVTVPVGYGDGYHRILSNKTEVLIRNKRYPVRGIICMDQMMVEIGKDEAYIGDEVVLFGEMGGEKILVEEIAKLALTNTYEIVSSLTERLPRVYVGND